MTEKEFADKVLEVSFEFDRYIFAHPEVGETIPKGAAIVFILANDHEFNEHGLAIARANREKGQPVMLVKVDGLTPPLESRLINPHLEPALSI